MPDQDRFNRFMSQYVPFMVQRKVEQDRIRQYLEKSLQEYAAWGQQQEALQRSGLNKEVLLILMNLLKGRVEDSDRPVLQLMDLLKQTGIREAYPEMRLPTPTATYEEEIQPYQELGKNVLSSLGVMEYPQADIIENFIRLRGTKETKEFLDSITKGKKEKAEIAQREKEHALGEEELAVRKGELAVRKEEVGLEKTGKKTKTQLQRDVERWQKEREKYVDEYSGIGKDITYRMKPEQLRAIEIKIDRVDENLRKAEKELGIKILPDKEDEQEFERIATEEAGKGHKINWGAALMMGFSPSFINRLMKKLGNVPTGKK